MAVEQHRRGPFASLVRDSIDDDRVDRILQGIDGELCKACPHNRRTPRLVPIAVAAGFAALVVIALLLFVGDSGRGGSVSTIGPIEVVGVGELHEIEATETRRYDMNDGSSVELHTGTSVVAMENTGHRVSLRLGEGRARFDIVPGGPRRWSIDAGLAMVEVLGTEFTLERTHDRVSASVRRGRIHVVSELLEEGSRILEAGGTLVVEREEEPDPLFEDEDRIEPSASDAEAETVPRASWRQLASEGEYRAAYEILGGDGIRREMGSANSMELLLSLADVARLSGHAHDAVDPLERAVELYPTDRRAAVAAFTLGRLEADVLQRHGRAARAFERCLHLGAPRALREDTYARLAEVHAQGGNYPAARQAAQEYLRQFPDGQRAEELRQWVQPR